MLWVSVVDHVALVCADNLCMCSSRGLGREVNSGCYISAVRETSNVSTSKLSRRTTSTFKQTDLPVEDGSTEGSTCAVLLLVARSASV